MKAAKFDTLSKANQAAAIWIKSISKQLEVDRRTAWRALGAVLHALRDRLTEQQIAHLGGQLPLIVRGLFFEEWRPAKPQKLRRPDEFLDHVSARLKRVDTRHAVAAVFSTLQDHVSEFRKIMKSFPPGIRVLATLPEEVGASAFEWE